MLAATTAVISGTDLSRTSSAVDPEIAVWLAKWSRRVAGSLRARDGSCAPSAGSPGPGATGSGPCGAPAQDGLPGATAGSRSGSLCFLFVRRCEEPRRFPLISLLTGSSRRE